VSETYSTSRNIPESRQNIFCWRRKPFTVEKYSETQNKLKSRPFNFF